MEKFIKVRVLPKARKNDISEFSDGYKVRLTAAPEDGKANSLLIDILTRHFNLKKSQVSIISGKRSKNKLIKITEGR